MRVRWTRRARDQLQSIVGYVERDNPAAAHALLRETLEKTNRLAIFPLLGRTGYRAGTRELLVARRHLIVYRVRSDEIEIIQVWHVAQDRGRKHR